MPLFGKSQKSPAEVVKALKEAVTSLEKGDKKLEKAQEDVSKNLLLIKNMLYGTSDAEPQVPNSPAPDLLFFNFFMPSENIHLFL